VFILWFGAFSSICNTVNSTTDSDNAVIYRRSAAKRVRWTVLWCTRSENQKNQKSRHVTKKKRDAKDCGDVVAMTVNKCVLAETVRLNTAKQTCYHNNN